MKWILLTVPSAKEEWASLAEDVYQKKINHFIKFEVIKLKNKKNDRDSSDKKTTEEAKQILDFLEKDDFVVLFDESGEPLNSIKFAQKLNQIMLSGKKRAVFIIGGAFGVSDEVKTRSSLKISFSPMVFNHLVAEVIAMEQLYRGLTILKNIPYHNN